MKNTRNIVRQKPRGGVKPHRFKTLLFIFFLGVGCHLTAQTVVQVVTKNIERTMAYTQGMVLNIDAEKADIFIKSEPNTKDIKIKLDLIAKHPQLETAKKDMEALKYVADLLGKTVYLRNYIAVAKGSEKPSSDLRARYTISIPPDMAVSIKNNFGKLYVTDLTNKLNIVVEFCKTALTDIKGTITINTRFGDVEGNRLDGNIAIESNRSDLKLSNLRGMCAIKAQYGKININTDKDISKLSIVSDKADVFFTPHDNISANFNLETDYGKITLPKTWSIHYTDKTNTHEKLLFQRLYKQTDTKSDISIKTTLSSIFLSN
jgi:Putative adhesin